jgi:hypothetical protein
MPFNSEFDKEFSTTSWEEVILEVETGGKAPKKHGEGVYRFSAPLTFEVILPRRGWQLVKKAKNYIYLRPPIDQSKPPFYISIKIPNKEQTLAIANAFYQMDRPWYGQLGEWPSFYWHKKNTSMYRLGRDPVTGQQTQTLDGEPSISSEFRIGEIGTLYISAHKSGDGDFIYFKSGKIKGVQLKTEPIETFMEGEASLLPRNIYERNPQARAQCIKHFGATCQVCKLDFEKAYGNIGIGFIHVHHTAPIAARGGEYVVNPLTDLVPLCPNCHAMIHRRDPPYTVVELIELYKYSGSI